jgi:hypothetical protein
MGAWHERGHGHLRLGLLPRLYGRRDSAGAFSARMSAARCDPAPTKNAPREIGRASLALLSKRVQSAQVLTDLEFFQPEDLMQRLLGAAMPLHRKPSAACGPSRPPPPRSGSFVL